MIQTEKLMDAIKFYSDIHAPDPHPTTTTQDEL